MILVPSNGVEEIRISKWSSLQVFYLIEKRNTMPAMPKARMLDAAIQPLPIGPKSNSFSPSTPIYFIMVKFLGPFFPFGMVGRIFIS